MLAKRKKKIKTWKIKKIMHWKASRNEKISEKEINFLLKN